MTREEMVAVVEAHGGEVDENGVVFFPHCMWNLEQAAHYFTHGLQVDPIFKNAQDYARADRSK